MKVEDLLDQVENFDLLTKKDQVKLIAYFYCIENNVTSFNQNNVRNEFLKHSLAIPNISREITTLKTEKPVTLLDRKEGFSFHRSIKKQLDDIYLELKHKKEVSQTLRNLIPELKGNEQRKYLEEAISCFEIKSFRASILMTWLLTVDTIYEYIFLPSNLSIFNQAIQSHGKYKKTVITSKDHFSDIKEGDFIELLRVSKIISNDVRKILDEKLGIRNSCAHPNSVVILDYKAINFIQDLVINVIKKYQ